MVKKSLPYWVLLGRTQRKGKSRKKTISRTRILINLRKWVFWWGSLEWEKKNRTHDCAKKKRNGLDERKKIITLSEKTIEKPLEQKIKDVAKTKKRNR